MGKQEWISVEDGMPDLSGKPDYRCHEEVIVATKAGSVMHALWASNKYAKTDKGRAPRWERGGRLLEANITHWMPLPPPPQ